MPGATLTNDEGDKRLEKHSEKRFISRARKLPKDERKKGEGNGRNNDIKEIKSERRIIGESDDNKGKDGRDNYSIMLTVAKDEFVVCLH